MDKPTYTLEFEKPLRELEKQIEHLHQQALESKIDVSTEISAIERKLAETQRAIYTSLTPWQRVQVGPPSRHGLLRGSITSAALRSAKTSSELHGDRQFKRRPRASSVRPGTAIFRRPAPS